MGTYSDQSYNETRDFSNTVLQTSSERCDITCSNKFNNNTIISIRTGGSVIISQTCAIDNATCQLKATFEDDLTTLVQSTVDQASTAMGGLSLTANDIDQEIDISSVINNSVTQSMTSTCKINSSEELNNNYVFSLDTGGDISLLQDNSVKSSNCSADNYAKNSQFAKTVADASQTAKISNIFGLLIIGFIVVIIVIGIVLLAFILSGTASQAISSAGDVVKDNPELLL